jgi:hypothetical protein
MQTFVTEIAVHLANSSSTRNPDDSPIELKYESHTLCNSFCYMLYKMFLAFHSLARILENKLVVIWTNSNWQQA